MKKFTVIFLTIILLLGAFSLLACKRNPDEHVHLLQEYAAKEATCTQIGNKQYWKCTKCEKYFSDMDCKNEINFADAVISAKGHTEEIAAEVPATCEEQGFTEGKRCSACGEVLQQQQPIAPLGHNFVNGACTRCGISDPFHEVDFDGIEMVPQGDGKSFVVVGIGNCTDTQLTIPSQYNGYPVTAIADGAFLGNTNITKVVVSNGITSIGLAAFKNCTNLRTVLLPNTVKIVGGEAFSGCTALVDVTLGNGVEKIGDKAFEYCASLQHISIPDSILSVGQFAFNECHSLEYSKSAVFAYLGNANNKYLVLVAPVNNDTFGGKVNESTKVIAGIAFKGCEKLSYLQLSDSIVGVGADAFLGCNSMQTTEYNGALYLGIEGNDHFLLLRAKSPDITSCNIHPQTVVIAEQAFVGCSKLSEITIPDSVVTVGALAFNRCGNLKNITIGSGLRNLGDGAFGGCSNIEGISVATENSVFRSESNCLIEKSTQTLVLGNKSGVIPQSVTSIGERAFAGYGLQQVSLPDTVKFVGKYAFEGCANLASIRFGSGVTGIDVGAFQSCGKLKNLVIPNGVIYVGENAFSFSGLESVNVPGSVSSIGRNAFYYCTALKDVHLSYGLQTIGQAAFSGCASLANVTLPDSVKIVGQSAFLNCGALSSVQLGSGVVRIGASAFRGCKALTQITLPQSLEYIGELAFSGSGVQSVTFQNVQGWVAHNSEGVDKHTMDGEQLAEPQDAASYLTDYYCRYYWQCNFKGI